MSERIGIFDFNERLGFSRGIREKCDVHTILDMIPGSVSCVKTNEAQDRNGVDYIVTLRRGARVLVDAKARDWNAECPASRFWQGEPDLALEIWSAVEPGSSHRKTGWTLSEASNVDLIFFTFDPRDTTECFLLAFQTLRTAFRVNYHAWRRRFKSAWQQTVKGERAWHSQCMFVPISVVQDAMVKVAAGELRIVADDCDAMTCARCNNPAHELIDGVCPDCSTSPVSRGPSNGR